MKQKMNRNEKFFLIMAIFYTVISLAVLYIVVSVVGFSAMGVLLMLLAIICAAAQWLRFRKAHDEARGIVRKKKVPKFVPMPDKAETKSGEDHGTD